MKLPTLIDLPPNVKVHIEHFDNKKIKDLLKKFVPHTDGILNHVNRNTKFATKVVIYNNADEILAIGISKCGKHDVPHKKFGRTIAWNRAALNLHAQNTVA